jgi:hypothetical protein
MRLYLTYTPYHLLLANAIQFGSGDPQATIAYSDEAGILNEVPKLADAFGGAQLRVIPGLEQLTGIALHSQSRANDAAILKMARATLDRDDPVYMFNGLRSESQRLAAALSPGHLEYVEDGLDAYLPAAGGLPSTSNWWALFHMGLVGVPSRLALRRRMRGHPNSLNALTFVQYHALFPDVVRVPSERSSVAAIEPAWLRSSLERFTPLVSPLLPSTTLTHVRMLGNTERIEDMRAYLRQIEEWSRTVSASGNEPRRAVKPHPRERNKGFLDQIRNLGIAVLPHQIPAELMISVFEPDCTFTCGPTTFVMTSKLLLPQRRVEFPPGALTPAASFLMGWDPTITVAMAEHPPATSTPDSGNNRLRSPTG